MKTTEPKSLEQRINDALGNDQITSTELQALLQETEVHLSDATIKIERERAFDLTKSQDAAAEYRTLTEAEFTRNRLRLVQPDLCLGLSRSPGPP